MSDRLGVTVAERITSLCGGADLKAMHRWLQGRKWDARVFLGERGNSWADVLVWRESVYLNLEPVEHADPETALAMAIIAAVDANPEAAQ